MIFIKSIFYPSSVTIDILSNVLVSFILVWNFIYLSKSTSVIILFEIVRNSKLDKFAPIIDDKGIQFRVKYILSYKRT